MKAASIPSLRMFPTLKLVEHLLDNSSNGLNSQTIIRPIKLSSIAARYRREEFDRKAAWLSASRFWIKHVSFAVSPSCPVYPR